MHDAVPPRKTARKSHIESWMLDLLEDDRPAEDFDLQRVSELHWLYRDALLRAN